MPQEQTYAYFCTNAMKFVAMEISKPAYNKEQADPFMQHSIQPQFPFSRQN